MSKKTLLISLLSLGLLVSCGPTQTDSTSAASSPVSSSVPPSESGTESKPAPTSTSSSSSAAASSSSAVASSSSSASVSKPAESTSEAPAVEKAMAFTTADFIQEGGVDMLKVTGTISGYPNADSMKMAFGLQHKDATDGGMADELDGQWLTGSAEPADADYKYAPTVTDGNFEVKIPLTGFTFVKGAYDVYVGAKGNYKKIDLQQTDWGNGAVKANGLKMILRGDRDQIFAEELPPVILSEASTFVEGEGEGAKVFLKVGGELGSITAEAFQTLTIKVTCERQVGAWKQNVMAASKVTNVVEGTKAYIKIDVTELELGGYQVKLGFDGTGAPNTTMECESYDHRDNPTVLGSKEYAAYYAAGANDAAHLYGCCGLFIESAPMVITEATTRIEAENASAISNATITAKGEDAGVSGESYLAGMTKTSGWGGKTSTADFVVKVPQTSDYLLKVAYKCSATSTSALEYLIDGGAAKAIGTVSEDWGVVSELINLTAGSKHTITIRGISNVTSQLDYIELVKHSHTEMTFNGEAVTGTETLCAATNGTCTCGRAALKIEAGADLNHNLTTGGKLGKGTSGSYDGTKISKYVFNAAAAGTITLFAEGAFDASGNDARGFYSGKNGNATFDYNPDDETHPTNTLMKMNGVEITLPTAKYGDLLGTTTVNQFKLFKIADVAVIEGANEFTITGTNSYGLKYNYFAFLF